MSRPTIQTDLGTEVLCAKCNEYWPSDPEFFYFSGGKPHSWCKACYLADPKVMAKRKHWTDVISSRRQAARGVAK